MSVKRKVCCGYRVGGSTNRLVVNPRKRKHLLQEVVLSDDILPGVMCFKRMPMNL